MVEVTEIQDMQHLKSVKEWPQHMMILMLYSHMLADHVYIKEHRYIYLQETPKKGTKVPFFVITYFFPLLKNQPLSKGRAVLSQEPLSQKEEQPLSHHSK